MSRAHISRRDSMRRPGKTRVSRYLYAVFTPSGWIFRQVPSCRSLRAPRIEITDLASCHLCEKLHFEHKTRIAYRHGQSSIICPGGQGGDLVESGSQESDPWLHDQALFVILCVSRSLWSHSRACSPRNSIGGTRQTVLVGRRLDLILAMWLWEFTAKQPMTNLYMDWKARPTTTQKAQIEPPARLPAARKGVPNQ